MGVNAKASLEAPASKELDVFSSPRHPRHCISKLQRLNARSCRFCGAQQQPASWQSEVTNPALQKLQDSGSTGKTSKHALELPKFVQGISIFWTIWQSNAKSINSLCMAPWTWLRVRPLIWILHFWQVDRSFSHACFHYCQTLVIPLT